MHHVPPRIWLVGLSLCAAMAGPALAEKPEGPPGQSKRPANGAPAAQPEATRPFFGDTQQQAYRDYLRQSAQSGRCPPGLAKKNNGCLPPGLAKRWTLGQPLPSGVGLDKLPEEIRRRLGLPPPGYEYGRVDDDVVLIEIASRKVIEAILGQPGR
jgi:Ni/Co efflux regulator RcnB